MTRLIAVLVVAVLAVPATGVAAVVNDEVTSVKLKEADNNGSQDTNAGSGVKTGHLQNKAVTAAKMADGTITATQIADGAVTSAKIGGTISTSKLNVGTAAGTVSAGNHGHDGVYQRRFANVVVVAESGGDYTNPVDALAAITDASATKPYLVKIMPGVYSTGSTELWLKPYVEVEGSGQTATKIVGMVACVSNTSLRSLAVENPTWHAVLVAGSDVTMKDLSIKGYIAGLYISASSARVDLESLEISEESAGFEHYAILNSGTFDVRMHDVVAILDGPAYGGTGIAIKNNYATNTVMEGVRAVAKGGGTLYGIMNFVTTSVSISNSYVEATGPFGNTAIYNGGTGSSFSGVTAVANQGQQADCHVLVSGSASVDSSKLIGTCPDGVMGSGVLIGSSRVDGAISSGTGVKCVGVYNASYDSVTCL